MRFAPIIALLMIAALGGCTTARDTQPPRTATEQMLISAAADHVASKLQFNMPKGTKVFVDTQFFEGLDTKYTDAAIREQLLKQGADVVADRGSADVVVEIRSGAQSINQDSVIVGIPSFNIPIPLAGNFAFPEIALFKKAREIGVAKVAMTGYAQKTGEFKLASEPVYGFSHRTQWVVALFISWTTEDFMPKDVQQEYEHLGSPPDTSFESGPSGRPPPQPRSLSGQ